MHAELETLYKCASHDLYLRFHLIKQEVVHLLLGISYRTSDHKILEWIDKWEADDSTDSASSVMPFNNLELPVFLHSSDELGFLKHLYQAAKSCFEEVMDDKKAVKRLFTTCFSIEYLSSSIPHVADEEKRDQVSPIQAYFCYQAAYRLKANTLLERVGDLHDRFEQFFQRVSPDHPGSSLRRHSEQGAHDKYLTELTRWTHIDLARLVGTKDYLAGPYPYKSVPHTFHTLDYPRSATVHSFSTYKDFESWRTWQKKQQEQKESTKKSTEKVDSNGFITVRLPFWMPDMPYLQPILGHELAHQVLRDCYGRGTTMQTDSYQRDLSALGRTLRRLHNCTEAWGKRIPGNDATNWAPTLPVEILCDALAAIRFREAYAYTLFIGFLEDDSLAELVKDEYGMLRKLPNEKHMQQELVRLKTKSKVLRESSDQKLPRSYAAVGFIKNCQHSWGTGKFGTELIKSLEAHVDELNALFSHMYCPKSNQCIGDVARFSFNKQLGKDIARTLSDEGASHTQTDLRKASMDFWAHKNESGFKDPFRNRQKLSRDGLSMVNTLLRIPIGILDSTHDFAGMKLDNSAELPWQIEWAKSNRQYGAPLKPAELNAIDLSEEDFVFRTANPDTLFQLLLQTKELIKLPSGFSSNQIDSTEECNRHKIFHGPLIELNEKLKIDAASRKEFELSNKTNPEKPYKLPLNDLGTNILFQNGELEAWFSHGIRFELQMLAFTLLDKAAVHDNREALSDKKNAISTQTLLGLHDRFLLRAFEPENTSKRIHKFIGEGEDSKFAAYAIKSRTLIPLSFIGAPVDMTEFTNSCLKRASDSTVLIKVGLHWPGARFLFADWLRERKAANPALEMTAYLSTGWEDFVIFMKIKETYPEPVTDFVQKLNANKLVNSTESFWTKKLLDIEIDPTKYKVRFLCRMTSVPHVAQQQDFFTPNSLRNLLIALIGMHVSILDVGELQVYSAYGTADYEIFWEGFVAMAKNKQLLKALYEIPAIHRIETKVAFK